MKVCIYGAGAIGGMLGYHLAASGAAVTLIARGPHLAAMQAQGLTYVSAGKAATVAVRAVATPAEAGAQDYVILTLKAPGVAAIAELMAPLLGPETCVVTAQNGIPWWYFHKHGGPFDGRILESVDPGGRLWRLIPPERCLGCVVYPSAEIEAPGRVVHGYGNRFMLGEPDGSQSPRAKALSQLLTKSGLKAPVRPKIRDDIWVKLWGNLSFNPVSALTGGTLEQIARDPGTHGVVAGMMAEAERVATALGVSFGVDIETRIGWAADLGAHKTSMLQDLELGRAMEIDALLGVVVELGTLTAVPTPLCTAVLALLVQRARLKGCHPPAPT
jgi:2-dehydropantoate 2-reductase